MMKPTLFLILLLSFLLTGCQIQTPSPSITPKIDTTDGAKKIVLPSRAKTLAIDTLLSEIDIFAFRGGRLAHLGHNHVISSRDLSGNIYIDPEIHKSSFEIEFPIGKMIIDDEKIRAVYGNDFSKPVKPNKKAGTRKNLLSIKVLDEAQFPVIKIQSRNISGSLPDLSGDIAITLKGITKIVSTPIKVTKHDSNIHARGQIQLLQSDFGITPLSIFGGAITVQDQITVNFKIVAPYP